MGKRHKKQKQRPTWSRVILPKFIPPCPLCETSKRVEQEEDEPIIFECSDCKLEFVVLDNGEMVDLDDLIRTDGYDQRKAEMRAERDAKRGVYTLGLMVEENLA